MDDNEQFSPVLDSTGDECERRRYALLQAAAVLFSQLFIHVGTAVDAAESLLSEIERREREG